MFSDIIRAEDLKLTQLSLKYILLYKILFSYLGIVLLSPEHQ